MLAASYTMYQLMIECRKSDVYLDGHGYFLYTCLLPVISYFNFSESLSFDCLASLVCHIISAALAFSCSKTRPHISS